MFNRYGDITKFITDEDKLECVNNEVVISDRNDYYIVIDLEDSHDTFENLKSFIVIVAKSICEMDNIVLKFNNTKRISNKIIRDVALPAYGSICIDYSKLMDDPIMKVDKEFPFELEVISIEKPNFVTLDY